VTESLVASEVISEYTAEYSKYILSHHFPSPIDGLKKVKRRILVNQPIDKPFSGISMVANTLKFHPYGDSSTYSCATRMTDVFRSQFPLLNIKGSGGSYGGDKAAAARYTDFQISDFCKDIMFNDIDFKTIPMTPAEDLMAHEIKYFIPKLPTALMYDNESVGFGYSSRTFPLKFENVCILVTDFIKSKDRLRWDCKHLAKLLIPYFAVHLNIVNGAEMTAAYREGAHQVPVETEGIYLITAPNVVLFRTMFYGTTVENIRAGLDLIVKDKNHWAVKEFDATIKYLSEDVNYADFQITLKRGVNIFEFIQRIATVIRIRGKCHPRTNYVHNDNLVNLDIPSIIRLWYNERYRSKLGTLKYKQQKLFLSKMKVETYLTVCDYTDEVVAKLRSSEREEFSEWLRVRFKLSLRQCEIFSGASLQLLMKFKKVELTEQLDAIILEIEGINKAFTRIDEDLIAEIQTLKKRYSKLSKFVSSEPEYIGCLMIGNLGVIQIRNTTELDSLSNIFNTDLRFIRYTSNLKSIGFMRTSNVYTKLTVPYTVNSPAVMLTIAGAPLLFTRNKTRGVLAKNNYITTDRDVTAKHVSSKSKMLLSDGKIYDIGKSEVDPYKGHAKLLFMFDVGDTDDYWVISANSKIPNTIRIQRMGLKDKLVMTAGGSTTILEVVPTSVLSCTVQAPQGWRARFVEVVDMPKYLGDKKIVDVTVRKFLRW